MAFIRAARASDVDELVVLARSTFLATYVMINPENEDLLRAFTEETFTQEKILRDLEDPQTFLFVIEDGGPLLGYMKTILSGERTLDLDKLYFNVIHQGQGFGLDLLNEAKASAKRLGVDSIRLSVYEHNTRAIRFYEREGFSKTGEKNFLFSWQGKTYQDLDWILEFKLI